MAAALKDGLTVKDTPGSAIPVSRLHLGGDIVFSRP